MSTQPDTLQKQAGETQLWVAIDGPAGAGKSTLGRALAERLACHYLDTGLMYRGITLLALAARIPLCDADALAALARGTAFELRDNALSINGRDLTAQLQSSQVDAHVSEVSAHPRVRAELVARQRSLAGGRCIVMVGRDIGTVVLPEAPVKLWLTASAEERARRRAAQRSKPTGSDTERALSQIEARDRVDSGRQVSPARPAADAITIDTDHLSPDAALGLALEVVRTALYGPSE